RRAQLLAAGDLFGQCGTQPVELWIAVPVNHPTIMRRGAWVTRRWSPVVVSAFGSEHALKPGAIDFGQLVAYLGSLVPHRAVPRVGHGAARWPPDVRGGLQDRVDRRFRQREQQRVGAAEQLVAALIWPPAGEVAGQHDAAAAFVERVQSFASRQLVERVEADTLMQQHTLMIEFLRAETPLDRRDLICA